MINQRKDVSNWQSFEFFPESMMCLTQCVKSFSVSILNWEIPQTDRTYSFLAFLKHWYTHLHCVLIASWQQMTKRQ